MAFFLRPDQTFSYVLADDYREPKEKRTAWRLRILTRPQREEIVNSVGDDFDVRKAKYADLVRDVLRVGIAGWRNALDADGNPVVFETQECGELLGTRDQSTCISDALLKQMPPQMQQEIAVSILMGRVTDPEIADVGN